MPGQLKVEHVIQPALLCANLDQTMDRLHAMFGIFPSERVNIVNTGVNNAVYAFGGTTFLELIEPYAPDCAAMRLLNRIGEGWHMLAVHCTAASNRDADDAIAAAGVRVVRRNQTERIRGAWHLHPKDTHGVLLAMAIPRNPGDNSDWAGPAWREYVGTNTRVIARLLGVSIAVDNLAAARRTYAGLGFEFKLEREEGGDGVLEAPTSFGSFLQLRSPLAASSLAANSLRRRGNGLCHLVLETANFDLAAGRMEGAGVRFITAKEDANRLFTDPATTFGVPMELRAAEPPTLASNHGP